MKYRIKALRIKGHTITVEGRTVKCTNCMFQDVATFKPEGSVYRIVYLLYSQL